MPFIFQPIPGKPAFGVRKEKWDSSDQTTALRRRRRGFLDRRIDRIVDQNVRENFNKQKLISALYYDEDLAPAVTLTRGLDIDPKVDPKLQPFYQYYRVDPRGNLFGRNFCGINNYTDYMRFRPLGLVFY